MIPFYRSFPRTIQIIVRFFSHRLWLVTMLATLFAFIPGVSPARAAGCTVTSSENLS